MMDRLINVDISSPAVLGLLAATVVLAAAVMGLFNFKNQMPVEGKTVLVTGASEGLGRAAAVQFAAKGANVIVVARNEKNLQAVVREMEAAAKNPKQQRFHYITADVSVSGYAKGVVAKAMEWNSGRAPDVVWAIAGISIPMLWAEDEAVRALRAQMDVNFWGAAELSHAILREWLRPENSTSPKSEPKHFVFTSSVTAVFSVAGYGTYTSTKTAIRGLADTLADEMHLYPDNPVRIHVMFPATIDSPGLGRENATKPDVVLEIEKDDKPTSPEDVARECISGLEAGKYSVAIGTLGKLMRWSALGNMPRNSWVIDSLMQSVSWIVVYIAQTIIHGVIKAYAKKHGHPATYPKKVRNRDGF